MTTARFTHDAEGTPASAWPRASGDPLDLTGVRRLVVLAAHPDDESLGAGGLVATAAAAGLAVTLVVATSGEASHPGSPTHTPAELAARRIVETIAAAAELGLPPEEVRQLGLPDGRLADHLDELTTTLVGLVADGRDTLLISPWRGDGHPDHEAAGAAAATVARRTGATLAEYPIWFWHWGDPTDSRVDDLRRVSATDEAAAAKERAVAAYVSQVSALSDHPADATVLGPDLLAHFGRVERFWVTAAHDCTEQAFERLHREKSDPWGVDDRWFEERKRSLVLAMLPGRTFSSVLDVGCSTGALTAALATRLARGTEGTAARLLAVDGSAEAVAAARRRLGSDPAVTVTRLDVPASWPEGDFDLVVVSELAYFLSPVDVELLAARVAGSLGPDGVVVLCHWVHPIEGWVLDAAGVHRHFVAPDLPPLAATYDDRDVSIRVFASAWPEYDA